MAIEERIVFVDRTNREWRSIADAEKAERRYDLEKHLECLRLQIDLRQFEALNVEALEPIATYFNTLLQEAREFREKRHAASRT